MSQVRGVPGKQAAAATEASVLRDKVKQLEACRHGKNQLFTWKLNFMCCLLFRTSSDPMEHVPEQFGAPIMNSVIFPSPFQTTNMDVLLPCSCAFQTIWINVPEGSSQHSGQRFQRPLLETHETQLFRKCLVQDSTASAIRDGVQELRQKLKDAEARLSEFLRAWSAGSSVQHGAAVQQPVLLCC